MSRKKFSRFKVDRPTPDVEAHYITEYPSKMLHFTPDSLPTISAAAFFKNNYPLVIDVGCGRGDFLIAEAQEHLKTNFIGIDLHWKSLWDATNKAHEALLENIRYIRAEVPRVFEKIPDNSIATLYVLFPPVKKLDFISTDFMREVDRILKTDSAFHLATDQPDYLQAKCQLIGALELPWVQVATSSQYEGGITWFQRHWEQFGDHSHRVAYHKKADG